MVVVDAGGFVVGGDGLVVVVDEEGLVVGGCGQVVGEEGAVVDVEEGPGGTVGTDGFGSRGREVDVTVP